MDFDIKTIYADLNNDIQWLPEKTIFLTVHGSHAYGLSTPESDVDIRGICTLPKEYMLGFNKNFNEYVRNDPDATIFSLKKFFALSSQGNPNTLELLFTEPQFHLKVTNAAQLLLNNREAFISKQLKARYIGYAKSQAHRIKNHRSWLLNKMEVPPTRASLGLPERPLIEKNQYDAVKSLINKKLETWNPDFEPFSESQKIYLQGKVSDILTEMEITFDNKWEAAARTIGLNDNLIQVIKKEKEYENRLQDYASYQSWKKNRNPKRAALEEKYGFDLKHASHLIRLLRMGKEILETGKVNVMREDREEILEIKNGAWSYQKLVDYADQVEKEVEEAYKLSKLPNQPNIHLLDELCVSIIESSLKE